VIGKTTPQVHQRKDSVVWQKIALLALAGALGTLARWGMIALLERVTGTAFPWGTATVNVVGCFLAGLAWIAFEHHFPAAREMRVLILVGFMGAFTTFSALILETGEMLRAATWFYAAANLTLHNALGFAALYFGAMVGRML
jgi:CrcB protein